MAFKIADGFITGRTIKEYELLLHFAAPELKGKRVLDIGSGLGRFQEEGRELGIDVIGIDPYYKDLTYGVNYTGPRISTTDKIASINETLPIADNSFDTVLSLNSSLWHLPRSYPNIEERKIVAKEMLGEIVRVLRHGGEARACTFSEGDIKFFNDLLSDVARSQSTISWRFFNTPFNPSCNTLVLNKRS